MGRRLLKQNICRPLIDHVDIQCRYDFIQQISINNIYQKIETLLIGINDIERSNRKIKLCSIIVYLQCKVLKF